MSAPCKDCERRYLGCHSECADYIKYSRERNEMLDKKHQEYSILHDNEIVRNRAKGWLRNLKKDKR
ncbi:MAG: hypothetical protein IKB02_05350 [Clostridia bacterium]|nr:hypothetical protein [Clostridia bacterium]